MTLYVDTRWAGNHGIARFANEVVSRLTLDFLPLPARGKPQGFADVLSLGRARIPRKDLIFSPGYNTGLTRARTVVCVHDLIHLDTIEEASLRKRAYYNRVLRPAIVASGVVLTVSKTTQVRIQQWLNDDNVRIVDVGNGCSEAFTPSRTPYERRDNVILYVGNTKPHKNFEVVPAALRELKDFRLVVVSPDTAKVQEAVRRQGVEDRTEVLNSLDDVQLARLYRSASLLAMPSFLEGFGLPAAEAIRSGTPVLYWAGCQAVAEVVGAAGRCVQNPTDPLEWACEIKNLVSSVTTKDTSAWAETTAARYQWPDVAARIQAELEALL